MVENDINEYYSNINTDYLLNICQNIKFKNLIKLSVETKINIFNTNKNKWVPIDEASIQQIDILNNEKWLKIIEQEIEIDKDNENEN